jgi:hypothetical protein
MRHAMKVQHYKRLQSKKIKIKCSKLDLICCEKPKCIYMVLRPQPLFLPTGKNFLKKRDGYNESYPKYMWGKN